jgi:hypothetical protein
MLWRLNLGALWTTEHFDDVAGDQFRVASYLWTLSARR